jgi:2-polyprenyl-6-methoxyphenol hydroxylase-like FAD-dependent oxidoreductase
MRIAIAIVGAGLAGLATAAALTRAGHDVTVFEQAGGLRASGLAINLWSNATSLLPAFGIPADCIPGEPFSRMVWRASGREVTLMELPAKGLPHVNVERAVLLSALAGTLPADAISYGARCADVVALARGHDPVVVADGANSALRAAVTRPPRRQWTWTVWQASVTAELPEVPAGAGVSVLRAGLFVGVWRLGRGRITWFAEQPDRRPGDGTRLLEDLKADADPVIRTLARATSEQEWTEWHARDMWPSRTLYRANVVLVGDAAHPCCPRSARAPASASKTPRSWPRRSPPKTTSIWRCAATRRRVSPGCAGSSRWRGPAP